MNDAQLLRYSRHLLLDDIGFDGQQRLLDASVLVVGAGGLGAPALMYLASAGVGTLHVADGDDVELSNLQRQVLHGTDTIGWPKTRSAAAGLHRINPEPLVHCLPRLDDAALHRLVAQVDVVLDCSDSFATRHAVNRACVHHAVPLVSGAAIAFDGQFAVFDVRRPDSPCYACLYPEAAGAPDIACATMGVFAPLTGVIGSLQAVAALELLGGFGQPQPGRLTLFDARTLGFTTIDLPRDPLCPVCGHRAPQPAATGHATDTL